MHLWSEQLLILSSGCILAGRACRPTRALTLLRDRGRPRWAFACFTTAKPMTPERWQRVEELFHSALKLEESYRADFLGNACGGDEVLRGEVESLLTHKSEAKSFIEIPGWR